MIYFLHLIRWFPAVYSCGYVFGQCHDPLAQGLGLVVACVCFTIEVGGLPASGSFLWLV